MGEPWERGTEEPPRAYALFEDYLSLGPGCTLRQLAETGVASVAYLKELSARWQWRERTAAYQAHVARSAFPTPQEEGRQARDRLLREAQMLRRLAWAQMAQRAAEGKGPTPWELARVLRRGVSLELLLRPMPENPADSPDPSTDPAECDREPETDEERLQRYREEWGTPTAARAEILDRAQAAGVPAHLLPEVERLLEEMLAEMAQIRQQLSAQACPKIEDPGG